MFSSPFQYNILFENVGQYNSQKNYEWQFLRKWFELPKSCTLQWPLALQLFGGDRRHLVELILRDVDIFMIQIKGKRCGNFRVIERLFLRRTLHYLHTHLLHLLAAIPAETTRQFSVSLQRGHLQCPPF